MTCPIFAGGLSTDACGWLDAGSGVAETDGALSFWFSPPGDQMHRSVFAVVALAVSLVLAGCSPGGVDESPDSPSPSVSVPAPPSSVDAEMDALYAEAESVFMSSLELRDQFELRGDYSEFPAELQDFVADPYLSWLRETFEFMKEKRWRAPEGAEPVLTLRPYPGVSRDGSEVALQACMDTRATPALDEQGQVVSEGAIGYLELYFKRYDDKLKLFYGTTNKVEVCPLS